MWQTPCPGLPYRPVMRTQGVKGAQRHYYRVGSHLNFQTVKNETFHSVPELSGTYRGSFDVKSISSMTSGDFSDVYKYSGMQALFVTGRALTFFCLKALGNIWKMTPLLCACAVVITLETQKCRKGHLAPPIVTFILITIDRNGSRRMKEGQIYKILPQIF